MFPQLGTPELLIVLAIFLLLFGAGRISKIAGELGKGIKLFKDGLQGDDGEKQGRKKETTKS